MAVALVALVALVGSTYAYLFPPLTTSQLVVQSATVVGPAPITLDPNAYVDIPIESITATGRQFTVGGACSVLNTAGNGPAHRMTISVEVDGVAHGELRSWIIPAGDGYAYQTVSWPGSLVENIDPSTATTHTFKLVAWGMDGAMGVQECNYTVTAFQ